MITGFRLINDKNAVSALEMLNMSDEQINGFLDNIDKYEELSLEYQSKVSIGKLNVDNHPSIATKYGVRSIPCLLFFKNGEVQKQIMGSVPKSEIATALDELIK